MHTSRGSKKKGRPLLSLFVVGLLLLAGMLELSRRSAYSQLKALTVRMEQFGDGNAQKSQEEAKRIVAEVRQIIEISEDVEPTVATIVDVEQLRARNPFYNNAKNGDHLIVTSERAILYDPIAKRIVDVVPVQVQQAAPAPAPAEGQPAQ